LSQNHRLKPDKIVLDEQYFNSDSGCPNRQKTGNNELKNIHSHGFKTNPIRLKKEKRTTHLKA